MTESIDLVEESDRGCVLVAAALLETRLENIFRYVFKLNSIPKKIQDSLFDSNGPLSTFSSKAKLAFSLKLINKTIFEDIETVRRIRNEFAHSATAVDFIGHEVSKRIEAMHCVQEFKGSMQRYSSTHTEFEKPSVNEAFLRTKGYIKYTKSIFSLGVKSLEIELIKCLIKVTTPNV
jgi:DNA-binding MltR family transcriptional regulator